MRRMDACSWMSMRRTRMKIKGIVGAVLIIGAVIGLIICGVVSIAFAIQNPDNVV